MARILKKFLGIWRDLQLILNQIENDQLTLVWKTLKEITMISIYSLRVFHISFSLWSFTGFWVTVSLLKSPGLLSVFWPFSSSPLNNPLLNVAKALITLVKIVNFMFLSVFNSLAMSRYLYFFSHSFTFILWPSGTAKSTILQSLVFWPRLGDVNVR